MTLLDVPTKPKRSLQVPRRRRRIPAPPGNIFWRFVFPALVVLAGVAVFLLWRAGTKAVLDSTDGRLIDVITNPALPGYEAFVDPTPTLLIAHIDEGELVGVTIMARTALDDGGNIVVLSPDLLVPTDSAPGQTEVPLGQAFTSGGIENVQTLVESLFGFGFTETTVLDTQDLGDFMARAEPIPFGLADDLVQRNSSGGVDVWLEHGIKELDGTVAAQVFGFRNPGEFDVNRVERQLDMWKSWISQIAAAPNIDDAALTFEVGLSPYMRAFAAGTVDIQNVPTVALESESEALPLYELDEEGLKWISEKSVSMVPLPISTMATHRSSVRLLDGTGNSDNRVSMREELVADGEVIAIIGNAETFGIQETSVAYHTAEFKSEAARVAGSIGAKLISDEQIDLPYDITVTVGLDRGGS